MRLGPKSSVFALLVLTAFLVGRASGQTTASGGLSGMVVDQTGAVVPDAVVKIDDIAKGTSESWLGRKWDQAIEQSWKVLDLDANFVAGRWALARSYDCKGNLESAISSAQEAVQLAADNLFFLTDLGHAYAAAGRFAEAHKVLTELFEISKHRYVDPCFLAQVNVALG